MTERRPRPYMGGTWFCGPTPRYLDGGQSTTGHGYTVTIRSTDHTEELATVWTYLLPTQANARVMAAAPSLVDALEDLLDRDSPEARAAALALLETVLAPIDEEKPRQPGHTGYIHFAGSPP